VTSDRTGTSNRPASAQQPNRAPSVPPTEPVMTTLVSGLRFQKEIKKTPLNSDAKQVVGKHRKGNHESHHTQGHATQTS
jgi:hypothetical protein